MASKTPIDQLSSAITGILDEYGDDLQRNLNDITKKMGQKGAQALRKESGMKLVQHSGKYAKGWKYAFRKTRRTAQTTIYNEHYSLPHLLEYSHDVKNKKGGPVLGQTKPHPHIAPIAEELVKAYQKEVLDKL